MFWNVLWFDNCSISWLRLLQGETLQKKYYNDHVSVRNLTTFPILYYCCSYCKYFVCLIVLDSLQSFISLSIIICFPCFLAIFTHFVSWFYFVLFCFVLSFFKLQIMLASFYVSSLVFSSWFNFFLVCIMILQEPHDHSLILVKDPQGY